MARISGAWPSAGQGSSAVRGRSVSADLLGQGDDDARGAAQVAQQEDVLVLGHLAEELRAVGAQAGDGVMDVIDSEHDAMQAQRVGGGFAGPALTAAGAWYVVSSSLL